MVRTAAAPGPACVPAPDHGGTSADQREPLADQYGTLEGHDGPQEGQLGVGLRLVSPLAPDRRSATGVGGNYGPARNGADGMPAEPLAAGAPRVAGPDRTAADRPDHVPGGPDQPDHLSAGPVQADQADQESGSPDHGAGSVGPVGSGGPSQDVNAAAAAAYRASVQAGSPLSERRLAGMFGKTSRRWARGRMAEARQVPA